MAISGLSPPVRGSLSAKSSTDHEQRSIPARAGEPRTGDPTASFSGVYPRPCGGAVAQWWAGLITTGLSPPVRGSQTVKIQNLLVDRSIPARAGEPERETGVGRQSPVYPRPCGGAPHPSRPRQGRSGLSPPVRGSLQTLEPIIGLLRSIPARAGEPLDLVAATDPAGVYPRPCGGAFD